MVSKRIFTIIHPHCSLCLTDRNVVEAVELINQWPHNCNINSQILQLGEAQVVLNDADDIATDTVNVGIHGQMAMGVCHAAIQGLTVVWPASTEPTQ
jgi:hypothetical protein